MIEKLFANMTPSGAVFGIIAILYLWIKIRQYKRDSHIRSLGGHAPIVRTYLPMSLDFVYKALKAASVKVELVFWTDLLMRHRSTTVELNPRSKLRSIFTADHENIKAILAGQFGDYGKGEQFHKEWYDFLGDSIFVTDGEQWAQSRHLIRPMFVRERIVDTEIFEKHVTKLIHMLAGERNPAGNRVIDVGPLFFRYTLDAATDYLLGKGVDSLDNPKTVFAEAFQNVLTRQSDLFRAGPYSIFMSRKTFHEDLKRMDDFLQPYIEHVLSLSKEELDDKLSIRESFLDALARFTKDPKVLRDQLVSVLLAGRDTTAATLAFCLFELSRNPDVVRKLRAEIANKLGRGKDGMKPTYTDLKEMKYLNAVINETMRLYPVVPFNVRHALKDTTLPRGGGPDGSAPIGILEGTRIIYSTMIMQRRRDLYEENANVHVHEHESFGEEKQDPKSDPDFQSGSGSGSESESASGAYFDPLVFNPDRWVSGTWQAKPWQFIPFNGGPRICLGQQFALIEMGYTVTRILQTFKEIISVPSSSSTSGATATATAKAAEINEKAENDIISGNSTTIRQVRKEDPLFKFDVTLSPAQELSCIFLKDDNDEL